MDKIILNYALITDGETALMVGHCQVFTDSTIVEFEAAEEALQYASIHGITLEAPEE